jgi:hypothetical protein
MELFSKWSSEPINLERGLQYSHAVLDVTLEGQFKCIRGYGGFCLKYIKVQPGQLSLDIYKDPQAFASFLSYLRARNVHCGRMLAHCSLAKKINDFLAASEATPEVDKAHGRDMATWLAKLEIQLRAVVPEATPAKMQSGHTVLAWARDVCIMAIAAAEDSVRLHGTLTHKVAQQVHDALLVSLVTGAHTPPLRLGHIKSWLHPSEVAKFGCRQQGCQRENCLGNHLELVVDPVGKQAVAEEDAWMDHRGLMRGFSYRNTRIKAHMEHGKTQRMNNFTRVSYILPDGDLTKLFLLHIKQGHALLVLEQPYKTRTLIVGKRGADISHNNSLFTHLWNDIMHKCPIRKAYKLETFPPNDARTMFVETYTSDTGNAPEFWDGAAVVGNSVQQWGASYNPSKRSRLAQQAVDAHQAYAQNALAISQ